MVEDNVDERFFHRERLRALVGIALYALAGVVGYLLAPTLALAVFVVLPEHHGSHVGRLAPRPRAASTEDGAVTRSAGV